MAKCRKLELFAEQKLLELHVPKKILNKLKPVHQRFTGIRLGFAVPLWLVLDLVLISTKSKFWFWIWFCQESKLGFGFGFDFGVYSVSDLVSVSQL